MTGPQARTCCFIIFSSLSNVGNKQLFFPSCQQSQAPSQPVTLQSVSSGWSMGRTTTHTPTHTHALMRSYTRPYAGTVARDGRASCCPKRMYFLTFFCAGTSSVCHRRSIVQCVMMIIVLFGSVWPCSSSLSVSHSLFFSFPHCDCCFLWENEV